MESPHKGPVMQSFCVLLDISLNKLLNKQSSCTWFGLSWCSCNGSLNFLLLDKMAHILQTTFSDVFSWMKATVFSVRFHWRLFVRSNWQKVSIILGNEWFVAVWWEPIIWTSGTQFTDAFIYHQLLFSIYGWTRSQPIRNDGTKATSSLIGWDLAQS